MGLISFIKSVCVQTAVYWGNPKPDGYGGQTFATPIEIKCRWDDVNELFINKDGEEKTSSAKVLVTQDLDKNGWLFLGALADLDSSMTPENMDDVYRIMKIQKTSLFKSTDEFVRTIYL